MRKPSPMRLTILRSLVNTPLNFEGMFTAVRLTHPESVEGMSKHDARHKISALVYFIKRSGLIQRMGLRDNNDLYTLTEEGRKIVAKAQIAPPPQEKPKARATAPSGFDLVITHTPTGSTYVFTQGETVFTFKPRSVTQTVQ